MTSFTFNVIDQVSGPVRQIAASFRAANSPLAGFRSGLSSLLPVMNRVQGEAGQTSSSIKGIGSPLKGLSGMLPGIGSAMAGVFAVDKVFEFGRGVVDTLAKFERFEAVLTNTLGDNGMAKAVMADIKQFAATTPFQVDELTDSFVKLANRGFAPNMAQMTMMGDLAASTGKSYDMLVEAILDAETGEFERLKEFGIRASKEGDKVRLAFKNISKEVDFNPQSIRSFLLELGEVAPGVKGSMAAISQTTGGMLSNIEDQWTALKLGIGQVFAPFLAKMLPKVTEGLTSMAGWIEKNGNKFSEAIGYVRAQFQVVQPWIERHFQVIAKFGMAVWPILYKVGEVLFSVLGPIIRGSYRLFDWLFSGITGWLNANQASIIEWVGVVGSGIKAIAGLTIWATQGLVKGFQWVWSVLGGLFEWFKENNIISYLVKLFPGAWAAIKGFFTQVLDWLVSNIFKPIVDFFVGVFDAMGKDLAIKAPVVDSAQGSDAEGNYRSGEYRETAGGSTAGFLDKFNSQFGAPTGGRTGGSKSPIKDGLSSVTGGGGNVKHININIQKLVESLNINTTTLGMGRSEVKSEMERLLLSVVNDVNY